MHMNRQQQLGADNVFPAYGTVAALLATLAVIADLSPLDRVVAAAWFDPLSGSFPAQHAWWAEQLMHRGGIWLVSAVALIAASALLASIWRPSWRRQAVFVLVCIGLSTGSVALLKRNSNVDCPWDVAEFGGSNVYTTLWQAKPVGSATNHCFPGAHSSGGFSLVALAFLLALRRHRWTRHAFIAAFVIGTAYALTQWARGAHFPSHDLWSAFIAWSVASLLARRLLLARSRASLPARESYGIAQPASGIAALLALMLIGVGVSSPVRAQGLETQSPLIVEIVFRGNKTTREEVMQREISIATGQPANAAAIEISRQSIQDLGLFRAVTASQETLDGGVRVVFSVREKWYLLGYPRLSANTDGQNALGAELRWNNVMGRNHSLRTSFSSADKQDEGRGREEKFKVNYGAPFVFGSRYSLDLSGDHSVTPINEDGLVYDETVESAQFLLSRKLGQGGAASQGWRLGSGLRWRRETLEGESAPRSWGDTYGLVTRLSYADLRDHIFSETGSVFAARYEIADQNVGSDYSYSNLLTTFKHSRALGQRAHQTLEFGAELGLANNGPDGRHDYSLGGANGLRGYKRNHFEGDFYYLVSASYLRPLHWDWLRFVATLEAGNVYREADEINTEIRSSFEIGLRVRAPKLVNFEFELGLAFPIDNDSGRIYGSRNGF